MRFKVQLSNISREGRRDQPVLLLTDYSLNMVLYKLDRKIDARKGENMTGKIEPHELDIAIQAVVDFQNGYCNLDEQHQMLLLKATLEWAKQYSYSVEWLKA